MALIDTGKSPFRTPIIVENGEQRVVFNSENAVLSKLLIHLVIEDVDDFTQPITVDYLQGNIDNMVNPTDNKLIGSDYMTPIKDCEGNIIQSTIEANGNYFIALDTFYGKFGNLVIKMGSATTGKIRAAISTMFYGK